MRLLLVTNVHPSPRRPTKGTFNGEMVAALRAAGDDVRVIVPTPWTDLFRTSAGSAPPAGVTCPTWWYPPRTAHHVHHRWMARAIVPAGLRIARDWRPDIVMGYWAHPDGTVAVDLAQRLGVPSVLIVGGSDIQILARDPARRAIIVDTLQRADRVLAIGAPLRDATIALGVPDSRVGSFMRGVDTARFQPGDRAASRTQLDLPRDRPIALWVGRMVPVKGLDVLLAAWRDVATDPSRPLLVLAGDGELRGALERDAAAMRDSVRFVGTVAHAELPMWYRAADLTVLPSRSEGVPNVLVESLACGTPFVASAVGAVSELAGGDSITVPPGDVAALARALRAQLSRPPMSVRTVMPMVDRADAIVALRRELTGVLDHARTPHAA